MSSKAADRPRPKAGDKKAPRVPTQEEIEARRIVHITNETVTDITSTDFPGHWPGEDHAWDVEKFKDKFQVQLHHLDADKLTSSFSLIGIDASVANAFRRIMIAEIPSLAIEHVFIHNNTSIIQDEVLAARLGLIPFKGGQEGLFNFLKDIKKVEKKDDEDQFEGAMDYNTVVLELKIECSRNPDAAPGERDPEKLYKNAHVLAEHIEFKPYGRQAEFFSGANAIQPTNPKILVAKMRPGQVIDLEMHAIKGLGNDHAKFSPVATASYRLLPTIKILKPILGKKDTQLFQSCFPKGVIGIEKVTKEEAALKGSAYEGHEGDDKVVVLDPMLDTVSRECLRHKEFEGKVQLGRIRDHFIFQVESVGQWDSDQLFLESIKVLQRKCEVFRKDLKRMRG